MLRRLASLPLVVALAAGCGGSSRSTTTATTAPPTHAARPLPFRATLHAATHTPRATAAWPYTVRVTDLRGRPIRARIRMQVLFGGVPVGKVDGGRTFTFVGVWREPRNSPVVWPRAARGRPLVFEAIVSAKGRTTKLDYPVRVR